MSQAASAEAQAPRWLPGLLGPRLAFDVLLRCVQSPQPRRGEHYGGAVVVFTLLKEFVKT